MSADAHRAVAESFALLAAIHHLAILIVLVIFWIRRRSMERTIALYFAAAFASAGVALATQPGARVHAAVSLVLAVLWCIEFGRPGNVLSFRETPRLRLAAMFVLGLYGLAYPGSSGDLPSFFFAPLGVTLPPTLTVALALLNAASPNTNRVLHWSSATVGLVVGIVGVLTDSVIHAPLVAIGAYAILLLAGFGRSIEARDETTGKSVRGMRDRMYERRVLLSRPRKTATRRPDFRRRRRR